MSLPHALLGLISYHPATGYEIKGIFDKSIHFFWNATLPQIYRTLSQMQAQGWLTVTVEHQEGRPSRKVYSVTASGREEMRRWLAEAPDIPSPRLALLIKVFFGNQGDPAVLRAHLEAWRAHHAALLEAYDQKVSPAIPGYAAMAGVVEDASFWALTLDFGRRYAAMVVEWCDAALTVITHQSP